MSLQASILLSLTVYQENVGPLVWCRCVCCWLANEWVTDFSSSSSASDDGCAVAAVQSFTTLACHRHKLIDLMRESTPECADRAGVAALLLLSGACSRTRPTWHFRASFLARVARRRRAGVD